MTIANAVASGAEKATETLTLGTLAGARGGWIGMAYLVGALGTLAYEASRSKAGKMNPQVIPVDNLGVQAVEIAVLWPVHLVMMATGMGMGSAPKAA